MSLATPDLEKIGEYERAYDTMDYAIEALRSCPNHIGINLHPKTLNEWQGYMAAANSRRVFVSRSRLDPTLYITEIHDTPKDSVNGGSARRITVFDPQQGRRIS